MATKPFPSNVAIQSTPDGLHPKWKGFPQKFHRPGAKHIERGAHYTRKVSLAEAMKHGWEPCRVCFRGQLDPLPTDVERAAAKARKLTDAALLSKLPRADRAAPLARRESLLRAEGAKRQCRRSHAPARPRSLRDAAVHK